MSTQRVNHNLSMRMTLHLSEQASDVRAQVLEDHQQQWRHDIQMYVFLSSSRCNACWLSTWPEEQKGRFLPRHINFKSGRSGPPTQWRGFYFINRGGLTNVECLQRKLSVHSGLVKRLYWDELLFSLDVKCYIVSLCEFVWAATASSLHI